MKNILFIIFIILSSTNIFSQEKKTFDSLPYIRIPEFSLHGRVAHSNSPFFIKIKEKETVNLNYRTNNKLTLGFGFNYKDIGLSIGVGIPVYFKDTSQYTPTSAIIIYIDGQYWKLFGDLSIKGYKGYTDESYENNIHRPDIINTNIIGNIRYKFNDQYNYLSAKGFSGKYYKSTFSPYAGIKISQLNVRGDSSIISNTNSNITSIIKDATYINEFVIGITGGICYIYVYKDLFFHIIAGGGIMFSEENYKRFEDHYFSANEFDFITDIKFNFGYNAHKTFAIIETRYNQQLYNTKNNLLRSLYTQIILKIGHRF